MQRAIFCNIIVMRNQIREKKRYSQLFIKFICIHVVIFISGRVARGALTRDQVRGWLPMLVTIKAR